MKVLAINGSFRREGNTDIIIDKILQGADAKGAAAEKLFVDDLKLNSCQGCLECRQDGVCQQQDGLSGVVKKIDEADVVVIGSPIYGNYVTGQLKIMLDRMMGVISRVVYVPGGGIKSVTRLDTKKRNIIIVLTAGAPTPESADDALKLLRRMMGSLQNGGLMEEIVAIGINAKGAIMFTKKEWMAAARKYGVQDVETYAENAVARNQSVLERAYELGKKLAEQ